MPGGFTAVDLSQLPAPTVVEVLDYETILAEILADLRARDPLFDALVESDTAYKVLEVVALRELIVRQRVNDAAKAVMLAYAVGADLDNIGALFSVERLLLDAGDANAVPPVPATYESDTDYRRRIQLSLEGYSTAGPEGAYIFHALSADGDVLDASAISPTPGDVTVSILSRTGDGTAAAGLLATVDAVLASDGVRPLTDNVTVASAAIINYSIAATLYFYAGPDRTVALALAQSNIDAYKVTQHRLGLDITLSGIYAALHVAGVQRVDLASPAADIAVDRQSAAYCTVTTVLDGGLDE